MREYHDMNNAETTRLPKVQNRKDFIEYLEDMISQPSHGGAEHSSGRPRELKTYVVESNDNFPRHFTLGDISGEVIDTGIDKTKILRVKYAGGHLEFFLDITDGRFFTLHTNEKSEDANRVISAMTEDHGHAFDHAWFYSDMLKRFSKKPGNAFRGFGVSYTDSTFAAESNADSEIEDLNLSVNGTLATDVQRLIEKEPRVGRAMAYDTVRVLRGQPSDSVQDDIHNNGYFAVKRGKSAQDHLNLVDSCREEYAETVHAVEKSRTGVRGAEHKMLAGGDSFDFEFCNEIEDVDFFISKMFNSAKPFRLWGLKTKIADNYYKVTAVDLHAGGSVHFDIAKNSMRVGIYDGACGNTILRLFTNLQVHYDSKITCKQMRC